MSFAIPQTTDIHWNVHPNGDAFCPTVLLSVECMLEYVSNTYPNADGDVHFNKQCSAHRLLLNSDIYLEVYQILAHCLHLHAAVCSNLNYLWDNWARGTDISGSAFFKVSSFQ